MTLPLFFHSGQLVTASELQLEEETGRHIVQVLRMKAGDRISLTDGEGNEAITSITRAEKKKCFVAIQEVIHHERSSPALHLCVAFTKNSSRNEWLLEKATELGVTTIVPIMAARSERERIRYDRWRNVLVAALIQSQQYYLPQLHEAASVPGLLQRFNGIPQKFVGHCMRGETRLPLKDVMNGQKDTVILIGPEGDFTAEEVLHCRDHGFVGIELGSQRLRTETAAMAACAYFNLIK
jgi:16S rRNA (uracil1498-N3)-methyltransferase